MLRRGRKVIYRGHRERSFYPLKLRKGGETLVFHFMDSWDCERLEKTLGILTCRVAMLKEVCL
jgi:hypothetical protein